MGTKLGTSYFDMIWLTLKEHSLRVNIQIFSTFLRYFYYDECRCEGYLSIFDISMTTSAITNSYLIVSFFIVKHIVISYKIQTLPNPKGYQHIIVMKEPNNNMFCDHQQILSNFRILQQ